jgi:hypothetical protein
VISPPTFRVCSNSPVFAWKVLLKVADVLFGALRKV